ncbi:hypothetical protein OIE71_05065 [Streptomyces sp. NBC_01725]|uniref:hypothetical protein n=1 Tax=Streptomyces sp. NBC_01725 TaxID=2975923 RepID=UPI002E295DC8|nr:hypothetical protein [Streptomyces sp. NBC_01725]
MAEEELRWLRSHFENPLGYAEAYEKLEEQSTVLLDGSNGDGRNATAKVLLLRIPNSGRRVHEVLLDEKESARLLDPEIIGDDDRLLLDLSRESDARWRRVLTDLSSYRETVGHRHSKLVVILPPGAAPHLSPELNRLRFEISRPPGMELDIIKRHLRVANDDPTLADSMPEGLKDFLSEIRPLTQVATFSHYVCEARRNGEAFHTSCAKALDTLRRRPESAAHFIRKKSKQSARALLVTVAMLHGARSDAIHRAATQLLDIVDATARKRPALQHRLLSERLKPLGAVIDRHGRVRFTDLGLDVAVRTCVWNDFPQLREHLREWVGEAVTVPELDPADRNAFIARFAEQSLACRRPQDLRTLIDSWSRSAHNMTRQQAAIFALGQALHHHEYGGAFRSATYDWATDNQLSPARRKLLVEVCRDDMAVSHPNAAVVRLHHLARREDQGTSAREALLHLAREDRRLSRRMLARVASALSPAAGEFPTARFRQQDLILFLEHSAPEPLVDAGTRTHSLIHEPTVRNDLTRGWTEVFRDVPAGRWTPYAEKWFAAACALPLVADLMLDTLITACERRGDRLGMLHRAARSWATSSQIPDKNIRALPGRILVKINIFTHAHAQDALTKERTTQ